VALRAFLAWHADKGTTSGTIANYITSINSFLGRALLTPAEVQPFVRAVARRSASAPAARTVERLPLPASAAWEAVVAAYTLARSSQHLQPDGLVLFRDHLLVAFGFLTLLRADSLFHICASDVAIHPDGSISATITHEKVRRGPARVVHRPWACCNGHVAELLRLFIAARTSLAVPSSGRPENLWMLSSDPPTRASADFVSACLRRSLAALGVSPSPHGAFSSHSLRIGGACAAASIGVPLNIICALGGWASDSDVAQHYVRNALPDPAARAFFGYCLPASGPPPSA